MGKLTNLLQAGYSVMLESVPVLGKIFAVLHEMDNIEKFSRLMHFQHHHSRVLNDVAGAIYNIESRVDSINAVRELKEYDKTNGLVLLPKLLYEDPAFEVFWQRPHEFGGRKELLSQVTKEEHSFSILMSDMLGQKWVYHIPIHTFGLMLQNRSLGKTPEQKSVGYDPSSQTHWITNASALIVGEENTVSASGIELPTELGPISIHNGEIPDIFDNSANVPDPPPIPPIDWEIPSDFLFLKERMYTCGRVKKRVREYRHVKTDMEFVLILGGTLCLSAEDINAYQLNSRSQKERIELRPFFISKFPVTQLVWRKIMGSTPSRFRGDDRPVEKVSWFDAREFCRQTGLGFPSEAQWEYACRGGTASCYHWGDYRKYWNNYDALQHAWYTDNAGGETHPVGHKQPNAFGLYDMMGNVCEWCADSEDCDCISDCGSTLQELGSNVRICRGGGYWLTQLQPGADRRRVSASRRISDIGFRVCFTMFDHSAEGKNPSTTFEDKPYQSTFDILTDAKSNEPQTQFEDNPWESIFDMEEHLSDKPTVHITPNNASREKHFPADLLSSAAEDDDPEQTTKTPEQRDMELCLAQLAKNPYDYNVINQYVELAIDIGDVAAAIRQLTMFAWRLDQSGRREEAENCYEYILEIDPNNREAKKRLQRG